jgi:hypothetical protein
MTVSLPAAAQPAWSAYTAMNTTKQRHLGYLQQLEEKYKKYGNPNAEEVSTLNHLLQEHDAQVKAFRKALQAVKVTDGNAYIALINAMKEKPVHP